MKLNNKGFAVSSIMYLILMMAIVLIATTLAILSSRKLILDKLKNEVSNKINNSLSISYRGALKELRLATENYLNTGITQEEGYVDSVAVSYLKNNNYLTTLDNNALDYYNLSDKYIGYSNNGSGYNYYLGKSKSYNSDSNTIVANNDILDVLDYKIYGNSVQDGEELFNNANITELHVFGGTTDSDLRYGIQFDNLNGTHQITSNNYDGYIYYKTVSNGVYSNVFDLNSSKTVIISSGTSLMIYANTDIIFNTHAISLKQIYPTPESPIDVVSLGENSKNLFDKTTVLLGKDLAIATGGTYNNADRFVSDYIPVTPGTTYYINYQVVKYGCYYDSNKVFLGTENYFASRTITPPVGTAYIKFAGLKTELDTLQLEVGNTETEYRPYRYIDINVNGKNLFNKNNINASDIIQIENGISVDIIAGNSSRSAGVTLQELCPEMKAGKTYRIKYTAIDANYNMSIGSYSTENLWRNDTTRVITLENLSSIVHFGGGNTAEYRRIIFTNIQIEEGSTATDYEPYKMPSTTTIDLIGHEPLRKIGEYADYIDYENKRIARNIYKVSNIQFSSASYSTVSYSFLSTPPYPIKMVKGTDVLNPGSYSNKFNGMDLSATYNNIKNKNYICMPYITSNNISTMVFRFNNSVTDYSVANEIVGNDLEFYYVLETPIYEDITLPEMVLKKDLKHLTVPANLNSSKIEFEVVQKIVEIKS